MSSRAGVFISVLADHFEPKAFTEAGAAVDAFEKKVGLAGVSGLDGISKLSQKVRSVGQSLIGFGAKMTAGVTLPIVGGFALAVKAGADEERQITLLHAALVKNTGATKDQLKAVDEWITKTQNATGVLDDDLRPALQKLVISGRSVSQAQHDLGVALDISAARGKPLNAVIEAMSKAANGSTGALGRLGIATFSMTASSTQLKKAQLDVEKAMRAAADAAAKHGKNSLEARTASNQLATAQAKLTSLQKDGTKTALSYDQILAKASKTMGGDAAKAAQTTAGKVAILKARMHDLTETVGMTLLPVANKLLGWFAKAAGFVEHLSPAMRTGIIVFLALAAAIGPLVTIVGAFVTAISFLISPIGLVVLAIAALVAGIVLLWTHWKQVWGFIQNNPAIAIVAGLILLPVASIVALVGIVKWLAANWREVWASVQSVIRAVQPVVAAVVDFVGGKLDQVVAWAQKNAATFSDAWDNISGAVSFAVKLIAGYITWWISNVLQPAFDWFARYAVPVLMAAWNLIKSIVSAALLIIEGVIQTFLAVIGGDWGKAWDGIKMIVAGVWDAIVAVARTGIELVWIAIQAGLALVVKVFTLAWNQAFAILKAAWNLMLSTVRAVWNQIYAVVTAIPGRIVGALSGLAGLLLNIGLSAMHGLLSGIVSAWGAVYGWLRGLAARVVAGVGNIAGALLGVGREIVQGLKNGISNAWSSLTGWVKDKVQSLVDDIKSGFGIFSPSRVTRYHGQMLVEGLRLGMQDGLTSLTAMAARIVAAATPKLPDPQLAFLAGLPTNASAAARVSLAAGNGTNTSSTSISLVQHVDARGATDPDAVGAAAKDGLQQALRELTRYQRTA
jgi:phage-related protein